MILQARILSSVMDTVQLKPPVVPHLQYLRILGHIQTPLGARYRVLCSVRNAKAAPTCASEYRSISHQSRQKPRSRRFERELHGFQIPALMICEYHTALRRRQARYQTLRPRQLPEYGANPLLGNMRPELLPDIRELTWPASWRASREPPCRRAGTYSQQHHLRLRSIPGLQHCGRDNMPR
ncbi:hypothetical protein ASPBRDRAFT_49430 [Aspergillus brasiliensis CBS 101740]|uniref:Uncharacterized protein n=1 Tax=Aspergillus brasiliensis (strain CBS 101740 / IMI 381727 / IBT 21946) TaxID=767769 RepID=A0A1L9U292_ASPBC|nr:hypothetical protein ASPBRDRAFT_49735 [Aspergillus brasiliensis CBS 101740]OJJ65816.1 hypothetical protein ASPBRDRAFT_49430 [Aspergillus brasiliensis CBS 101740]